MPRPRFHALTRERQEAIVDAALDEFATRGFAAASLNQIIIRAGTSKGSMYYYFEGKEDLYAYVLRRQVEKLIAHAGPFPVPAATEPDAFWSTVEDIFQRLVAAFDASPVLASVLRDWLTGTGSPTMQNAQRDAEQAALPWMNQTLAAGQSIGAIRTDLPDALLLAVGTALGRVIDSWVIAEAPDPVDHAPAVHAVVGILRRAIQP
ncbi:TetR/AcrR family transcriptional regulator [Microbacterium sp. 22242]|uniref:TetR/AcrR family transcriptional regulator n=1 Tax=Microbacterium sp. 22242 TaxID=3453896 RepID=UPI003F8480EB